MNKLMNYKEHTYPYSLDGRYFNKVLIPEDYPGLIEEPLIISVNYINKDVESGMDSTIQIDRDNLYPSILRMIIEMKDGDTIISRHSNLLIINHKNMTVLRFDPMEHHYQNMINEYIKSVFPLYTFIMDPRHPQQKDSIDHYCVAYVIKYAYFYINNEPVEFDIHDDSDVICSDNDIEHFAHAITHIYGSLDSSIDGPPDIEHGNMDPTATGVLVGGLGGAAIGGIVGGPGGALVGGLGGAALGGLIGSSQSRNNRYNDRYHGRYNHRGYRQYY